MKRSHSAWLALMLTTSVIGCSHNSTATRPVIHPRPSGEAGLASMRAQDLFRRGEYALAIEAFRRQVRIAPEAPDGYNGIAACYDMIGRFDLAEKFYQMALARAPMDGRIYRNMARSLAMQGRNGEGDALLAEWEAIRAGKMVAAALPDEIVPAAAERETADKVAAATAPDQANESMAAAPATIALADAPRAPVQPETASMSASPPREAEIAAVPVRQKPAPAMAETAAASMPVVKKAPVNLVASGMPSAHPQAAVLPVARNNVQPVFGSTRNAAIARGASSLPVRIMNAAGQRGLARRVQSHLARVGLPQTQVGDANRRYRLSWVVYPLGQREQAIAIQKKLPFTTRAIPEARASRIVVLLGFNATRMLAKPKQG